MTQNTGSRPFAVLVALVVAGPAIAHPDTDAFTQTAFLETPKIVDCMLEDGTEAQCNQITVGYLPEGLEIGPFCPAPKMAPVASPQVSTRPLWHSALSRRR